VRKWIVVALAATLALTGCAQRPLDRRGTAAPSAATATPPASPSVAAQPDPAQPPPAPVPAGPGSATSGITGRTVLDVCPVTREQPCGDRPISVTLEVLPPGGLTALATVTSGSDGSFRIGLAPGRYQLRSATTGARWPKGVTLGVTVEAGRYTNVMVRLDSGIR